MEFYQTVRGAKFFDSDFPKAARALESIARHLEKQENADNNKKEPPVVEMIARKDLDNVMVELLKSNIIEKPAAGYDEGYSNGYEIAISDLQDYIRAYGQSLLAKKNPVNQLINPCSTEVSALLQDETKNEKLGELFSTLKMEMQSDDSNPDREAKYLLKAYLAGDVDAFCVALCGWSMRSLLAKAKLIEDAEGGLSSMIKDALFTSVWDGSYEVTTPCRVNLDTKEVVNIETSPVNCETLNTLNKEYITIDGENFDVYQADDKPDNNAFWYN